jgi:hypothetical protein
VVAVAQPACDSGPAEGRRRKRPGRFEIALAAAVLSLAAIGTAAVHRLAPWIPPAYLGGLAAAPMALWWLARWAHLPRRWSWPGIALATLALVALLPVPWMRVPPDRAPGMAWRLDGRLEIDGVVVDPPGRWYWLTAGRPPIVAELVGGWLSGDDVAKNMLGGSQAGRPAVAEPAAASTGLRRAGWQLPMGITVEAYGPTDSTLPERVIVDAINGHTVSTRASWEAATAALGERNTFSDKDGSRHAFVGRRFPYRHVDLIDTPRGDLDVVVGGRLGRTALGSWFRKLSLGSSHGLIVALAAYAYASGEDLAAGRTVAATGKIRYDGRVGWIGGLRAKAHAARDVGADILLFPAGQDALLSGFDSGSMQLCPVLTLDDAIDALARSAEGGDC